MNAPAIEPPAPPHKSTPQNPFPVLTVDDDPTLPRFVGWLRGILRAFDNWGEPEPDDATEYGSFVRNAGLIAAYLGFDRLCQESLEIAPNAPKELFGAVIPICSQDKAYLFFASCISKALQEIRTQDQNGAAPDAAVPAESAKDTSSADSSDSNAIPLRFAQALEWVKQAKIRNGSSYPDTYVDAWAKRNTGSYDLPVPKTYYTFARYLRAGRQFLKEVGAETIDDVQIANGASLHDC